MVLVTDHHLSQAVNKAVKTRSRKNSSGKLGEKLVLQQLKADSNFKKVIHSSRKDSRLGYDIETRRADGASEYHEVKASQRLRFAPSIWYIASNQVDKARKLGAKFNFWFVNNILGTTPSIKKFKPNDLDFDPGRFVVTVRQDQVRSKRLCFDASELVANLDSNSALGKAASPRRGKALDSEAEKQISRAVYTREFLARKLKARHSSDYKSIDCNFGQASCEQPYHLKYINAENKEVHVDLKVTEGFASSKNHEHIRFYLTKNRLEEAKLLNNHSRIRREFWDCNIDPIAKQLTVKVFDIR